jgi:DNA-directed RNA polymerase specialized sigma24 family protein
MTDQLARMLMLLVDRYSRSPQFNRYSFKEDMKSEAILNLCNNALKFDPAKSSNPFAFYTTAIRNSFLQYLNHEKKQRIVRDTLLVENGETPSYSFQEHGQSHLDSIYGTDHEGEADQIIPPDDSYTELGVEPSIDDLENIPEDGEEVEVLEGELQEASQKTVNRPYGFGKKEQKPEDLSKVPKKVLRGRHIKQFVEFS